MLRTLLGLACLAILAVPCRAEPTITPTETLIPLTVEPMAAPRPALRHLLLPDLLELQPGNPIQNYLVCMLQEQFLFEGDAVVRRDKLLAQPLKEFPAKELEDYGGAGLRLADRAARMDKPDWQILLKVKTDGIGLLLPDVQQMRQMAAALQVRFRAELALGHFDKALGTARTMFALSRHMGEHPTLIGDLVAIAIAFITIAPLEEMLEQPGCPNLYWALTDLPCPMVSLRGGMDGERALIRAELPGLTDRVPMTTEQLRTVIDRLDKLFRFEVFPTKHKSVRLYLDARLKEKDALKSARRRLVEVGVPEERLLSFPDYQVLLLDERREYEEQRDEVMKLITLPAWQGEALAPKKKPDRSQWLLASLVPAIDKVRRAQGRLEQRIGMLRHVEALRMYAAAHDGKLPAKLSDCPVPLPDDPFSGKPFRYQVEGNTAHLRGTAPPGAENQPGFNVHYAVTIRGK